MKGKEQLVCVEKKIFNNSYRNEYILVVRQTFSVYMAVETQMLKKGFYCYFKK